MIAKKSFFILFVIKQYHKRERDVFMNMSMIAKRDVDFMQTIKKQQSE